MSMYWLEICASRFLELFTALPYPPPLRPDVANIHQDDEWIERLGHPIESNDYLAAKLSILFRPSLNRVERKDQQRSFFYCLLIMNRVLGYFQINSICF